MDVEYVTDLDTEQARLQWCARRRRELVPTPRFLAGAALVAWLGLGVTWRGERGLSAPFVVAAAAQIGAWWLAVAARDPARARPLPCPHAELGTLGLLAISFAVGFRYRGSLLAFVLLAVVLTAAAALAARAWHGFAIARRYVPFAGRAEHVHLDARGLEVTLRPNPAPRRIAWESVRYVGVDADTMFVVAGVVPVVVPRRACKTGAAWQAFVAAAGTYAASATRARARLRRTSRPRRRVRSAH
jgi:hypothetical protein